MEIVGGENQSVEAELRHSSLPPTLRCPAGGKKMKFLATSLLTALLVTYVVPVQSQQTGDQTGLPAEEYAIYASVIREMFAGDKVSFDTQTKVKMLVIEDRTVRNAYVAIWSEDDWGRMKEQFTSLSQETIDDYVKKNAKTHQLTNSFDLKLKYILTPREEIERIFKSGMDGWAEFYKQFPDSGGYMGMSRAGINPGGNQAFVYMQHTCSGTCGSGHYLLLVRNNQGWVVQQKVMAWIS